MSLLGLGTEQEVLERDCCMRSWAMNVSRSLRTA